MNFAVPIKKLLLFICNSDFLKKREKLYFHIAKIYYLV